MAYQRLQPVRNFYQTEKPKPAENLVRAEELWKTTHWKEQDVHLHHIRLFVNLLSPDIREASQVKSLQASAGTPPSDGIRVVFFPFPGLHDRVSWVYE